jgi:hypothetical protein
MIASNLNIRYIMAKTPSLNLAPTSPATADPQRSLMILTKKVTLRILNNVVTDRINPSHDVVIVGDTITNPTLEKVQSAISANAPFNALILHEHGLVQDRHSNKGVKMGAAAGSEQQKPEMHTSSSLFGSDETISHITKIYDSFQVESRPRDIILASCFGGALSSDLQRSASSFAEGTNILATGSSKYSVWSDNVNAMVARYLSASSKGPVDFVNFFAQESLIEAETLQFSHIVQDANGKNHTITIKARAPKNEATLRQALYSATSQDFFTSISDYEEGGKSHQNSHFVVMADAETRANCRDKIEGLKQGVIEATKKAMAQDHDFQAKYATSLASTYGVRGKFELLKALAISDLPYISDKTTQEIMRVAMREGDAVLDTIIKPLYIKEPSSIQKTVDLLVAAMHKGEARNTKTIEFVLEELNQKLHQIPGDALLKLVAEANAFKKGLSPQIAEILRRHISQTQSIDILTHTNENKQNIVHLSVLCQGKLITEGCDINLQDKDGNTPLHLAIMNGNDEAVGDLLAKTSSIEVSTEAQNKDGKTPIDLAIESGDQKILAGILRYALCSNHKRLPGLLKPGVLNVQSIQSLLEHQGDDLFNYVLQCNNAAEVWTSLKNAGFKEVTLYSDKLIAALEQNKIDVMPLITFPEPGRYNFMQAISHGASVLNEDKAIEKTAAFVAYMISRGAKAGLILTEEERGGCFLRPPISRMPAAVHNMFSPDQAIRDTAIEQALAKIPGLSSIAPRTQPHQSESATTASAGPSPILPASVHTAAAEAGQVLLEAAKLLPSAPSSDLVSPAKSTGRSGGMFP